MQVGYRDHDDSGSDGTFQTFTRLNGTDADSGVNLIATSSQSDPCGQNSTQTINVADTVKGGATTLEVGVLKTGTDTSAVRVGAIRAVVTYNRAPSAPTLASPANGSSTTDATPMFDWNEDSTDPDTSSPVATPGSTATLFPNGQGTYTAWTNGESEIDETGATDCSSDESVIEGSGTGDRESVLISLTSVPDGATITTVDVQVGYRDHDDSGSDGTFQTFTRLNGTDADSGVDLIATSSQSDPCGQNSTQTINVADTVKGGATTLEVGVLKDGSRHQRRPRGSYPRGCQLHGGYRRDHRRDAVHLRHQQGAVRLRLVQLGRRDDQQRKQLGVHARVGHGPGDLLLARPHARRARARRSVERPLDADDRVSGGERAAGGDRRRRLGHRGHAGSTIAQGDAARATTPTAVTAERCR